MLTGSEFFRWLKRNALRLLVSIVVAVELHVLGLFILGHDDVQLIDLLDVGSTALLTIALFVLYLPGLLVYFFVLRRIAGLSRPRMLRPIAVATSPVIGIVLGLLYAVPHQTSQGWVANIYAALLFGVVVTFPTPKSGDRTTSSRRNPRELDV